MHPPTQILKKNGAASPILRWKEVFTTLAQMPLRELVLSSLGITVDLYAGRVRLVPIMPGWRREPWQMSVVTRWEDEARSKALSDFAAYVALEAEATWAPIREETNRVVEEAFRRRLRS